MAATQTPPRYDESLIPHLPRAHRPVLRPPEQPPSSLPRNTHATLCTSTRTTRRCEPATTATVSARTAACSPSTRCRRWTLRRAAAVTATATATPPSLSTAKRSARHSLKLRTDPRLHLAARCDALPASWTCIRITSRAEVRRRRAIATIRCRWATSRRLPWAKGLATRLTPRRDLRTWHPMARKCMLQPLSIRRSDGSTAVRRVQ